MFTWSWVLAETGRTCSWDFSKAEEKEEQVRAAKAARGKARQQKADRHSQRLTQQREKAALALARLTADPSHEDAAEHDSANGDASSSLQSSAIDEHMETAATKSSDDSSRGVHSHMANQPDASMQHDCTAWSVSARAHDGSCETTQAAELTLSRSLPVTIHRQSRLHSLASADDNSNSMQTASASHLQVGSAPPRRLAGTAGYPSRHMTVPGPLLHGCAVESRRDSSSSMQSWQIVRPRPVKSDRGVARGPSHVNVQA